MNSATELVKTMKTFLLPIYLFMRNCLLNENGRKRLGVDCVKCWNWVCANWGWVLAVIVVVVCACILMKLLKASDNESNNKKGGVSCE